MTEKILEIRYKCLQHSCLIKSCREGKLTVSEDIFDQLSASSEDKTSFKSPRGLCRLGFSQTLQVIHISSKANAGGADLEEEIGSDLAAGGRIEDPIGIFKEEHKTVLNKLDLIEEQIRKRDVDGLWIITADIENDILLHSIEKEEGVLFPLLENASGLTTSAIAIMKEDHRELMALLHSLRDGLREGDILDGVAYSVLANLRSHICKEDNEFFEMAESFLEPEMKAHLLKGMKKADDLHIVIEAGERCMEISSEKDALSVEKERFNEALLAVKESSRGDDSCH